MIFPVESEVSYTKPHVTGAVYAESPQIRGHNHPMIHLNQGLLPDSGAAPSRSRFLPALFSVADTAGTHSTLRALLWGLQPADTAGTHSTLGALLWGLQPHPHPTPSVTVTVSGLALSDPCCLGPYSSLIPHGLFPQLNKNASRALLQNLKL